MSDRELDAISGRVRQSFQDDLAILSFPEWFEQMQAEPARHLRSASQYVRDVFDHFGTERRRLPRGEVDRFRLFDAPWADGEGRLAGQEQVQQELYRLISNFVRDGKVSRLILMHGPNGSAKSTIARCIQRAMEHYSHTPEGAVYSYAWIFPSEKITKSSLGFADRDGPPPPRAGDTYARLKPEQIDARLPCELHDHPIFLIPRRERRALIDRLRREGRLAADFVVSKYILEGDLSPRDRAIYDALLVAHDGDHAEVLRHVQVMRFYMSVRYQRGLATIEPQLSVDASAQQLTADRSIANLPRALQNVKLFQIGGPLVSANRGLLEYSDILKRPLEALKYLLTTSEEATASMTEFKIQLDELLIASTNEVYLEAFKKNPDWNSFKGRIELIAVPYLRRFADEVEIYEPQINATTITKPLAPHVVEVAAMWAVLTRLERPKPDRDTFPKPVKELIRRLTPIEKVRLYDTGEVPSWCSAQQAKELRRTIGALWDESRTATQYEGHRGASAREIRTLILNAAHRPKYRTLQPLAVFEELEELVSDRSVYEFLQDEVQDGYRDHEGFVAQVKKWWTDLLDVEVRSSMGLVEETRYDELFERYVLHVSHAVKGEKLQDKVTGVFGKPDEALMKEVETSILAEKERPSDFRQAIISQIGAWSLENPGQRPDYRRLFSHYIEKMEADFFRERAKLIAKNLVLVLKVANEEGAELSEEDREVARRTLDTMRERHGYPEACTAECVAYLLKARYADQMG